MDIRSFLPIAEQGFDISSTEKYIDYLQTEYEKIREWGTGLSENAEKLLEAHEKLIAENEQLKRLAGQPEKTSPPSIATVNEIFVGKIIMDLLENAEQTRIDASEKILRSIADLRSKSDKRWG